MKTASFKCSHCTYSSTKKYNLQRHVNLKHSVISEEQIEKHKCISCSYETKWKFDLKSHLLYRHTDSSHIAWLNCEKCKFKAKTKTDLKRHDLHRHTNVTRIKWYSCLKCEYKSKTAVNLKRHVTCSHDKSNEHKKNKRKLKNNRKHKYCENKIRNSDEIKKEGDGIKQERYEETSNEYMKITDTQINGNGGSNNDLDTKKLTDCDTYDYKMSADGFIYLKNLY